MQRFPGSLLARTRKGREKKERTNPRIVMHVHDISEELQTCSLVRWWIRKVWLVVRAYRNFRRICSNQCMAQRSFPCYSPVKEAAKLKREIGNHGKHRFVLFQSKQRSRTRSREASRRSRSHPLRSKEFTSVSSANR